MLSARRDLTQYTRQRAECLRLLDQGRSVAEVAGVLERHPVTVRAAVHRFEEGEVAGLPDGLRPGRPARPLGAENRAALGRLLDGSAQARITWTVPALHGWLRDERGVGISADWLGELLRREVWTRRSTRSASKPARTAARPPRRPRPPSSTP
ncbi:helix-turn-helix domain-containing protein [Streptomyces sp. NBC_00237]|uniref:helix-turn-helix domain-containing protein n=1 Tax=Streptomyces sp. NBC_00237 TaxID=2975687 RepID=UPI00338D7E50